MTDQASDVPEDRPAATPTAKRKRKRPAAKKTTGPQQVSATAAVTEGEVAPSSDAPEAAAAAVTLEEPAPEAGPVDVVPTSGAATSDDEDPNGDQHLEAVGEPDDAVAGDADPDDSHPAPEVEQEPAAEPRDPETSGEEEVAIDEHPEREAGDSDGAETRPVEEPSAAAPTAATWPPAVNDAWPEPTLTSDQREWEKPTPPARRELGKREAGLALAFLALGITSGVLIGSTTTVPLAPPALVSHEVTFERIIADAQQKTVTIAVESGNGATARGAGTAIGKDGTVITTNAVVSSPGGTIRVTTYDGRTLAGEFIGTDQTTGLTVIRVRGLTTAGFTATSADVAAGSRVAVIGQNNNVATTDVASPRQAVNTITGNAGVGTWTGAVRLAATDDATATGGPIINDSGALVGIAVSGVTTGRDSDPERRQYGITAGTAVTVARSIASTGVALHGLIGAEVSDETTGVLGARITDIADAGPAKTAGLRDGDVIVSYNGARIGSAAQLVAAVRGTDPGTKADVELIRNGKERTVRVKITATQ